MTTDENDVTSAEKHGPNVTPVEPNTESTGAVGGSSLVDCTTKKQTSNELTDEVAETVKKLRPDEPLATLDAENVDEKDGDSPSDSVETKAESPKEMVNIVVVYNKTSHNVSFPLEEKIFALRLEIEKLTGVPPAMQKIIFKGKLSDQLTLRESGVTNGCKIMIIGSKLSDVLSVTRVTHETDKTTPSTSSSSVAKEPLCKLAAHKKVLDKGKPDDAMPAWRNVPSPLPAEPIWAKNKVGGKVRLTFKLECDQVWIGTNQRTEKVPMASVRNVISEPIEGHEDYHILAIQLGPTEQSRYWLYWVPAQYVAAIKRTILGS